MNTAGIPLIGQKITATPFVPQLNGEFVLILKEGLTLEWGHRFDPEFGYRVYLKFKESDAINCMPPSMARKWAVNIRKDEKMIEMLTLSRVMIELADEVDRLNDLWAEAGAPPEPLHEIKEAGNA